jgi:hypothetical protein
MLYRLSNNNQIYQGDETGRFEEGIITVEMERLKREGLEREGVRNDTMLGLI